MFITWLEEWIIGRAKGSNFLVSRSLMKQCFNWSVVIQSGNKESIYQICDNLERLSPKFQSSFHLCVCVFFLFSFCLAILLMSIQTTKAMNDVETIKIFGKRIVLFPPIKLKSFDGSAKLIFYHAFEMDKEKNGLRFCMQEINSSKF